MLDHGACFPDDSRAGFGKDREFACRDTGRNKRPGVQLPLRNTHQVSGLIYRDIDMCRTSVILDPAISIIAEDRHALSRLCHIRVAGNELIVVRLKVFIELRIRQQERH